MFKTVNFWFIISPLTIFFQNLGKSDNLNASMHEPYGDKIGNNTVL